MRNFGVFLKMKLWQKLLWVFFVLFFHNTTLVVYNGCVRACVREREHTALQQGIQYKSNQHPEHFLGEKIAAHSTH